tara:strand:+ start:161 stop:619 length:459 start_codon:yes stop_codon:yes gene_type:complete
MKLLEILKEIIDIYSPEELNSKDIEYRIDRDSPTRFRVELKYKDQYYILTILPLFNPKRPSINFGSSDEKYENLNLNQLLNSPYSSRILAAIFGLIRYWVDKHNIQQFEYGAEGNTRIKLYNYYLTKHFPDFENTNKVELIDSDIFIWEKKK